MPDLSSNKNQFSNKASEVRGAVDDVKQDVEVLKKQLLDSITLVKTFCSNFPTLNLNLNIRWLTPQDAIRLLLDLLANLLGMEIPDIRDMITQWLIKVMKPLERDISFKLKEGLKSCFACKLNPKIPDWMFDDGINIEVDQIDLTCMFKISPDSEFFNLLYDGNASTDMNRFLFDVIQADGVENTWQDPYTLKNIAIFKFIEEKTFVGYDKSQDTASNSNKGKQNIEERNNVINMKIDPSYRGETFITFINDYIDSQKPLFTSEKAVPQAMDFMFGVMSRKIDVNDICLYKQAEFDSAIEEAIKCGIDDPNVKLDDSFFSFTEKQIVDIRKLVDERRNGTKVFADCGGAESYMDTQTVASLGKRLKDTAPTGDTTTESGATATTAVYNEQITVINNGLEEMSEVVARNVPPQHKNKAKWSFIINFIDALKISVIKMILSPKVVYLIMTFYYLVNGQARFSSSQGSIIKQFIKKLICVLRPLIEELLKKLIYELLLPLVLKAVAVLLKCYIKIKVREKLKHQTAHITSYVPGLSFADILKSEGLKLAQGAANSAIDAGVDTASSQLSKSVNK